MIEDHLEKLKSFYAAATEKSFLKAAAAIQLTQPAVTKNVRILEEQLGTPLFLRHRRGVELTEAGRLLSAFCDTFFLKMKDVEKQISSNQKLAGVVRVGTYETLGELFWPNALQHLHLNFPDLVVELTTQNPTSIWSRLESGAIDLIVDAEPKTADHLFSRVLYTDHFGVFCKTNSRFLNQSESIPVSYVSSAIDKNGLSIGQHIRKLPVSFILQYKVESFTMTRSLIQNDVCVGVLPLSIAKAHLQQKTLQYFGRSKKGYLFGEHRICATSLESARRNSKIELLTQIFRDVAALPTAKARLPAN